MAVSQRSPVKSGAHTTWTLSVICVRLFLPQNGTVVVSTLTGSVLLMRMRKLSMRSFGRFIGVFESSSITAMYRTTPCRKGGKQLNLRLQERLLL